MKFFQTILLALTLSFVSHSLIAQDQDKSISVSVDIENVNGEEQRNIVINIDENGSKKEIKWSDDGTIPEDIKKQLEEEGVDIKILEGGSENEMSIFVIDNDEETTDEEHEIELKVISKDGDEGSFEIIIEGEEMELDEEHIKVIELEDGKEISLEIEDLLEEHDIDINQEGDGEKRIVIVEVEKQGEIEGLHEAHDIDIDIDTEKQIRLKILDENGEEKLLEWDGDGEMPAEIKEELEKEGIQIGSGDLIFIGDDGDSKVLTRKTEKYKIKTIDENGTEKVIEWNGEGEMPAEIKEHKDKVRGKHGGKHRKAKVKMKSSKGSNGNRAQLGVMIENDDKGVKVIDIIKGSAAEAAGFEKGYIITKADGKDVNKIEDLLDALRPFTPGENVVIDVEYDDANKASIELTLRGAEKTSNNFYIFKDVENSEKKQFKVLGELEDCDVTVSSDGKKKIVKIKKVVKKDEEETDEIKENISIDRKLNLTSFTASPNPTDGILNVKFEADNTPTEFRITDISGKQVYREVLGDFSGKFDKNIDLSEQVKGQFVISIIQGQKIFTENIILQ